MTYQATLNYLYSQLPMFHRIGAAAYKADLDNTLAICKILGNPEKKIKSIHVAGTNGKGSSAHMLAAIFQKAGYKTGLYTSPHLKDFRERIKINGKMIPKSKVISFVTKHSSAFEKIQPSFFEWTVGLAFDYFAKEKVDIAIIEVGLGGRLDSTNVIQPLVSLITNIGFDHTNLLGNTLTKIAKEKAGIIKKKTPVVISQHQKEVAHVFNARAKAEKTKIAYADKESELVSFYWEREFLNVTLCKTGSNHLSEYVLDLSGSYQVKNLQGVLKVCEFVRAKGFSKLNDQIIRSALRNVKKLSGLQGRWQTLSKNPLTICDTGHNIDGIHEVLNNLSRYDYKTLRVVIGVVNDKDVSGMLKLLPKNAVYYFTKASIPRALSERELAAMATKEGLKGKRYADVKSAMKAAQTDAKKSDLVFIGGSTFTVADAL